jgi:hypothetical protein
MGMPADWPEGASGDTKTCDVCKCPFSAVTDVNTHMKKLCTKCCIARRLLAEAIEVLLVGGWEVQ